MILKKNIMRTLTFCYLVVIIAELYAIYLESSSLELLIKPFLTIVLMMIYTLSVKKLNYWYVAVLFFALLGDGFMIYRFEKIPLLLGLMAFLFSHIFLLKILLGYNRDSTKSQLLVYTTPYLIGVGTIFFIVSDQLEEYFFPILIHTLVISVIANIAFLNYLSDNRKSNLWVFLGVFAFVGADCLFALYRFYNSGVLFSLFTTILYAVGQFLICKAEIARDNKTTTMLL